MLYLFFVEVTMKDEIKNQNKAKKMIKNLSFLIILIILTYYFIFRKIDRKGLQEALSNTNLLFILIALVVAFGNIFFEGVNHYRNLNLLKEKVSFKDSLKYAVVGFFFSAITPAATGGQPVQIYYMHKDKISYTNATVAILVQSFSYLLCMLLLGIFGYIYNFKYITSLGFFEYFFFIGVIVNLTIITVSLLAMFSKKLSNKLLNMVYKLVDKFNHEKALSIKEKMSNNLKEYHDSTDFIKSNKMVLIKSILTSMMQLITYHSVAYFVYLALGVKHLNYIEITSLQSLLYLSVSVLPLPGTVGVNETGFSIMYRPLIMISTIVDSSMLLTRGVGFYFYVILTGVILLIDSLKKKKNKEDM